VSLHIESCSTRINVPVCLQPHAPRNSSFLVEVGILRFQLRSVGATSTEISRANFRAHKVFFFLPRCSHKALTKQQTKVKKSVVEDLKKKVVVYLLFGLPLLFFLVEAHRRTLIYTSDHLSCGDNPPITRLFHLSILYTQECFHMSKVPPQP
jgi:hypothetical protein